MKAIDIYLKTEKINTIASKCPYDIPWLEKLMPKQDCRKGCSACWDKEIKEINNEEEEQWLI